MSRGGRCDVDRLASETTGDYATAQLLAEIAYQLGRIADTLNATLPTQPRKETTHA